MMASSKTRKYHTREILYNIYEDSIFHKNKEIRFVFINAQSFIKETEKFGQCIDLIYATVNPDHIATLKKHLDKAKLKKCLS